MADIATSPAPASPSLGHSSSSTFAPNTHSNSTLRQKRSYSDGSDEPMSDDGSGGEDSPSTETGGGGYIIASGSSGHRRRSAKRARSNVGASVEVQVEVEDEAEAGRQGDNERIPMATAPPTPPTSILGEGSGIQIVASPPQYAPATLTVSQDALGYGVAGGTRSQAHQESPLRNVLSIDEDDASVARMILEAATNSFASTGITSSLNSQTLTAEEDASITSTPAAFIPRTIAQRRSQRSPSRSPFSGPSPLQSRMFNDTIEPLRHSPTTFSFGSPPATDSSDVPARERRRRMITAALSPPTYSPWSPYPEGTWDANSQISLLDRLGGYIHSHSSPNMQVPWGPVFNQVEQQPQRSLAIPPLSHWMDRDRDESIRMELDSPPHIPTASVPSPARSPILRPPTPPPLIHRPGRISQSNGLIHLPPLSTTDVNSGSRNLHPAPGSSRSVSSLASPLASATQRTDSADVLPSSRWERQRVIRSWEEEGESSFFSRRQDASPTGLTSPTSRTNLSARPPTPIVPSDMPPLVDVSDSEDEVEDALPLRPARRPSIRISVSIEQERNESHRRDADSSHSITRTTPESQFQHFRQRHATRIIDDLDENDDLPPIPLPGDQDDDEDIRNSWLWGEGTVGHTHLANLRRGSHPSPPPPGAILNVAPERPQPPSFRRSDSIPTPSWPIASDVSVHPMAGNPWRRDPGAHALTSTNTSNTPLRMRMDDHLQRARSQVQDYYSIVSPRSWDHRAAGYDRPEVSPLTPSHPLPAAPRLPPRNLSIGGDTRIRTGYTPTATRNNSLAGGPGSPAFGSQNDIPASRSALFGLHDRRSSALSPLVTGSGLDLSGSTFNRSPGSAMSPTPWRGWTAETPRTAPISPSSRSHTDGHEPPPEFGQRLRPPVSFTPSNPFAYRPATNGGRSPLRLISDLHDDRGASHAPPSQAMPRAGLSRPSTNPTTQPAATFREEVRQVMLHRARARTANRQDSGPESPHFTSLEQQRLAIMRAQIQQRAYFNEHARQSLANHSARTSQPADLSIQELQQLRNRRLTSDLLLTPDATSPFSALMARDRDESESDDDVYTDANSDWVDRHVFSPVPTLPPTPPSRSRQSVPDESRRASLSGNRLHVDWYNDNIIEPTRQRQRNRDAHRRTSDIHSSGSSLLSSSRPNTQLDRTITPPPIHRHRVDPRFSPLFGPTDNSPERRRQRSPSPTRGSMTEHYLRLADRQRERRERTERRRSHRVMDDVDLPEAQRRRSAWYNGPFGMNALESATFRDHVLSLSFGYDGGPASGGLPSHLISLLPTGPFKDSKEAQKEERCPICLDDYGQEDMVMGIAECGHFFHKDCFGQWLKTSRTCPYCRQRINPKRSSSSGDRRPPPPSGFGGGGPSNTRASWRSSLPGQYPGDD